MEFSVENLCGLLIRSKLLTPDDIKAVYARWQAEGRDQVASSTHFLRWLAAHNYVTEYQAGLIAKGHADDFFLGAYKILDRLGRGRMAGVYKAVHQLGQTVAIKVLPPSKAKNPSLLARFQREARLALRLKHPNVVRSFQVGEGGALHYLVMEYLDGETLEEVLQRRKRLPTHEAVRVVHQALSGLQHIHEQGLVHRDLKPANLMLVPGRVPGEPDTTAAATVKVLDIGLGRTLFDENVLGEEMQLTTEGALLGTPDYMAPEQARDARTTDIRADIYSLGCVLYHCLTGQPPFPDTNVLNQIVRHATETPKPVRELNPSVPEGLQQVLNWMLDKDPGKRYPTPERAAQALQVFLMAGNEPAKGIEDAPQMRRYLTWLETGDAGKDGGKGRRGQPTPPPPVAKREPKLPRSARHDHGSKHGARKKKHKHRHGGSHHGNHQGKAAATAPPRKQEFDVELVPVPAPGAPAAAPPAPAAAAPGGSKLLARLGLTRRDWTLLGLGATGVIVAVLIGMGLAIALR